MIKDHLEDTDKQNLTIHIKNCIQQTNEWVLMKRDNATKWENQTNECIHYECDNSSGFIWWSMCNSSDNINRTCVNGQCIDGKVVEDRKWRVEISIEEIKAIDINITNIIDDIANLTGIAKEELTVGIEIDDNGHVISIIVYIEDEETANIVADWHITRTGSLESTITAEDQLPHL